jgi:predicted NBD/HSP70 family sugar kinase
LSHRKNKIIGGNAKLVRNINRAAILNLIRERQPISRVNISKITKLNKSTISSIVSDLLENGDLVEELVADNSVGRNPLHLTLNVEFNHVGAVNFDTKIIRVAIVDIGGKVVLRDEYRPLSNSPEEYVSQSVKCLNKLKNRLGITDLKGIGVTIAGLIDPNKGYVIVAPNLGWKDVKLGDLFQKYETRTSIIRFENDAEASALAELWSGNGMIKNYSSFVFVSVGAGLGTGIVINRSVIEGASHAAGEFGHMNLLESSEPCVCGNTGCWEAYASDRATVKRYLIRKKMKQDESMLIRIQDVILAAQNKDEVAIEVLKETGKFLGMGIGNIIRALDPPAIVIGGHILQVWDLVYKEILKGLSKRSFFGLEKRVKILPSSLVEIPRLLGAATLALERVFNDYKITK